MSRQSLATGAGALALALVVWSGAGCSSAPAPATSAAPGTARAVGTWADLPPAERAFLDTLEEKTFRFFWETTDAKTGLAPDRWPAKSFVSVAAVGFALTAYPIGAERGYITRAQAAARTRTTLDWFAAAGQDTARAGVTGHKGFYYHFLDPVTGHRFETVELSTQDTALLMAGVLFAQSYFDRSAADEVAIREQAEALYRRVDWTWAQPRPPAIVLGWSPEGGFLEWDYKGMNETMILYVLALGSPTHPVVPAAWSAYASTYTWGEMADEGEHVGFAPLFGHQYSHVWIDFRGIRDSTMRARELDYHENSRRATLAQRTYAVKNPHGFRGYGADLWGLTACDGPIDTVMVRGGRSIHFHTYNARGASFMNVEDDGTVAPTAAAGSIPFAPEVTVPALLAMRRAYGPPLFGQYGFVDALNPTYDAPGRVQHGQVVPGLGWFDTDYLGIDQGPILAMIENHRSGLVWQTLRRNPHIVRGLRRAGFTGGWLDAAGATP